MKRAKLELSKEQEKIMETALERLFNEDFLNDESKSRARKFRKFISKSLKYHECLNLLSNVLCRKKRQQQ